MTHLGQYIDTHSLLQELDPRVKILSVVMLSVVVLGAHVPMLAVLTCFLILVAVLCRLPLVVLVRALRPMAVFFALIFFMHLFFSKGRPIPPFPSWPVAPTFEGLNQGLVITWRFLLLAGNAAVLTMTTPAGHLVCGLERLLSPLSLLRVPVHDIALMVSLALRFLPTLLQEVKRVKEAQMARGARFDTGPYLERIKAVMRLAVPVMLGSLRRAEELSVAMEARGYGGGPRTYMNELRMVRTDWASLALVTAITVAGLL